MAAAQGGRHSEKRESYGHSVVVGPWGEVLYDGGEGVGDTSSSGDGDDEGHNFLGTVVIDLDKVTETREKMPVEKHLQKARKLVVS